MSVKPVKKNLEAPHFSPSNFTREKLTQLHKEILARTFTATVFVIVSAIKENI